MTPYRIYKHDNCTDMAIMPVENPFFITEKRGYKVKVRWFNVVKPENIFDMGVMETVFIKAEDMKNWKEVGGNVADTVTERQDSAEKCLWCGEPMPCLNRCWIDFDPSNNVWRR